MFAFLEQVEASPISRWLSESDAVYAFPGVLVIHTLGMALAAGGIVATSLRWCGVATAIPLERLRDLLKLALVGLALCVFSGMLLLLAYPTKALTNPIFYLKLTALGAAVGVARHLDGRIVRAQQVVSMRPGRWLAATLVALTVIVIVTGRLLPYTYTHLFARG